MLAAFVVRRQRCCLLTAGLSPMPVPWVREHGCVCTRWCTPVVYTGGVPVECTQVHAHHPGTHPGYTTPVPPPHPLHVSPLQRGASTLRHRVAAVRVTGSNIYRRRRCDHHSVVSRRSTSYPSSPSSIRPHSSSLHRIHAPTTGHNRTQLPARRSSFVVRCSR